MAYVEERELTAALPLLDRLPHPVLRIESDFLVSWMNRWARVEHDDLCGRCFELLDCPEYALDLEGAHCPLHQAERTGEPVSVLQIETDAAHQPGLTRVVALPIAGGGILALRQELGGGLVQDQLTKLCRKEYFPHLVSGQQALLQRLGKDYSVIFMDLDGLKAFNDRCGHQAGDELLRQAGEVVRSSIRAADVACRFGGDEIVIFLPDTGAKPAGVLAERICGAMRKLAIPTARGPRRPSASFGACTVGAEQPLEESVRMADLALYRAKAQGGDRIVFYRPPRGVAGRPGS